MNLAFSYNPQTDYELAEKGFKFLGAGNDDKGHEVHVFELMTIEALQSDPDASYKVLEDLIKKFKPHPVVSTEDLKNTLNPEFTLVLDRLIEVMNSDNGARFNITKDDYLRALWPISRFLEAGHFKESDSDYNNIDSSYWVMGAGEESDKTSQFSNVDKTSFDMLDSILDEIFNRGSED